jgi:hypothetical protein
MNLQKLTDSIARYKHFLRSHPQHDPYWKWESLKIFQENWDIEAPDLRSMYDRSLENSRTRRLWKRENYAPKDVMLKFIELNREYARQVFHDLFNENKDVEGRMDRFVFYCGELLREYKETYPRSIENSHYHDDDYQMISIYLAFRYPALYTIYDFEKFKQFMALIGSRDVPKVNDAARFFKVMRTVHGFIQKEGGILELHEQRLNPARHYMGETLLVVEDFYSFAAQENGPAAAANRSGGR